MDIQSLSRSLVEWAQGEPAVLAAALVGSHARGEATPASDIDLVLIVSDPGKFLADPAWAGRFGAVDRRQVEDYGKLTSLRVWYADGAEVEFGLTTREWAGLPLDAGTERVISGGMKVLFERESLLRPLAGASGA